MSRRKRNCGAALPCTCLNQRSRVILNCMNFAAVFGLLAWSGAHAATVPEWGQWGGPERNFQVPARQIAAEWPSEGKGRLDEFVEKVMPELVD